MKYVRILSLILPLVYTSCSYVKHSDAPAEDTSKGSINAKAAAGVALFNQNCTTCHGDMSATPLKDRTYEQIFTALQTIPAMQPLQTVLTDSQLQEIAAALRSDLDSEPPSIPQDLAGNANGPTAIQLSWSASTDEAPGTLSRYRIYRDGALIDSVSAPQTAYSDSGLTASTAYRYTVSALDEAGNESQPSAGLAITTAAPPIIPDTTAPTFHGVTSTVLSSTRVQISWGPATDTGGSGLKGYRIYRNSAFRVELSATASSHTETGLSAGTTYQYEVSAIDFAGNESPKIATTAIMPQASGATLYSQHCAGCHNPMASSSVRNKTALQISTKITEVPTMNSLSILGSDEIAAIANALSDSSDTSAPSVPGSFAATATSYAAVALSWTVSTDTGGSGMKSYLIYRNGTLLTTINNAQAAAYQDTTVMHSTQYKYTIRAKDVAGNQSALSAEKTVTTPVLPTTLDVTAPSVPASLRKVSSLYNTMTIAWNASTDDASGVVKYLIFRGTTKAGEVNAPTLTFTDTGLVSATDYSYSLQAVDAKGNTSAKSTAVTMKTSDPDAAAIYGARCASCHGSLSASNLKYRANTASDFVSLFTDAVSVSAGITEMQNKAQPAVELQALAVLLAGEPAPNAVPSFPATFVYSPPSGTRTWVSSFLTQVFISSTASTENTANMAIVSDLRGNAPALGGSCTRYDGDCPLITGANHDQYASAPPQPLQSAVRSGFLINACAKLLGTTTAVNTMLARAGLTSSSSMTEANLRLLQAVFVPAVPLSAGAADALMDTFDAAIAVGAPSLDAWKMVALPLCEYSVGGGL